MRHSVTTAATLLVLSLRSAAQSNPGILTLVTPAATPTGDALGSLSLDCESYYASYTMADSFDYVGAIPEVVGSTSSYLSLYNRLDQIYFKGITSLIDDPTAYLSTLAASASPWPETISSAIMSQATGLLMGYESIVSRDILGVTPSASITPGMSISVSGATATGSSGGGSTATGQATASASSAGAAVPFASAAPVMFSAAVAAAGVVGMALL